MSLKQRASLLAITWLLAGIIATAAGFTHQFYPWLSISLLPVLSALGSMGGYCLKKALTLPAQEKLLLSLITFTWSLHFLGVWVPETGFDAVWYHLPIAEAVTSLHDLVYLPDLYQSLNPLFSDVIFMMGYQVGAETGAKHIAYILGVSLLLLVYVFARVFTTRFWSLWTAAVVSSFQVLSWQSSSFYVDIAKAYWELASLFFLLQGCQESRPLWRRGLVLIAGLFLGASVGTKAFSLLLIPVFLGLVWWWSNRNLLQNLAWFGVGMVITGLPYYLRAYTYTQNPFISISLHVSKLAEIGGEAQLVPYLSKRITSLPWSILDLTLFVPDYVTFTLLILLPLLVWIMWKKKDNREVLGLGFFGLAQWLVWWLVPPPSTRYALSGFIVLTMMGIWAVQQFVQQHRAYYRPLVVVVALGWLINILPRLVVAHRNLEYLIERPSTAEYVSRFYDGHLDQHLKRWYHLN